MPASDEEAIRDLIATWMRASAAGDISQILPLMAEDVVFLIPGQPPMRGKDSFAAGFQEMQQHGRMEAVSDIQEIHVAGDLAYCWTHLQVVMTPLAEGTPIRRAGYTLSILRKNTGGNWVLVRDANMLAPEPA